MAVMELKIVDRYGNTKAADRGEDPSPFPALSQIEVYGTETFTTTGMQKEENYEPERADAERSAI